ncbi:MAG: hypothetical protein JKY60_17505, partial [Kordiimonadaceae bacterium]|nr:hypothetical protein [Kordiimonadaceae bacterium]
ASTQFIKADPLHWRRLLGDPKNRFLGDYMSQHWHIGDTHPVFMAADLGNDPRHAFNADIPDEIYKDYCVLWRWRPAPKENAPRPAGAQAAPEVSLNAPTAPSGKGAMPCV